MTSTPQPLFADQLIAVVGLACRLPQANGPDALWALLESGEVAIGEPPRDRGLTEPGGYVEGVEQFDAALFGLTPREAIMMDPHQRMALDLARLACEDAGLRPDADAHTTGVFMGGMSGGYDELLAGHESDRLFLTGTSRGLIANRVSHVLRLSGPSLTVDCGQSSSLASVVLATRSLRLGECDVALAGGVNLMLTPSGTEAARAFGALSPDFRCRPFDERANGYVRGEGGAVLVLRRLDDARRDGDPIRAVIRGGAVNNDAGATSLAVPSAEGQRGVIEAALRDAGATASDVAYVELHGTGTRVGDPVEAAALGAAFAEHSDPLLVGSVKSNIGHLEGAAGIAGLVKAVLALEHGVLPPNHDFTRPRDDLRLAQRGLRVVDEPTPLARDALVGVSSFGMGGTNVHVVLEGAPQPEAATPQPQPEPAVNGARVWLIGAGSPGGLAARAEALLETAATADPDRLAATLAHHSPRAPRTAALLGADRSEFVARLRRLAAGVPDVGIVTGSRRDGSIAALFTGQGAQRLGMGRALAAENPVFAAAYGDLLERLSVHLQTDLGAVIDGIDAALLTQTRHAQGALVAFEVACFRALEDAGVVPDVLVGHSIGELAAAHVAGCLSVDDLARLVAARGDLMQRLPAGGGMLAVQLSESDARAAAVHLPGVVVASVNGPTSTVLAGPVAELKALRSGLDGVRHRLLDVSHAFHSPLMEPAMDAFCAVAASVTHHPARRAVVSTLDGEVRTSFDADHWVRHALGAVRFADAVRTIRDLGAAHLVEVGPQAALLGMADETLGAGTCTLVPASSAQGDEAEHLRRAVVQLAVAGAPVALDALVPDAPRLRLPALARENRAYWPAASKAQPRAEAPRVLTEAPTPGSSRRPLEAIVAALRLVLGHGAETPIDADLSFHAHGLTSQGIVELCQRLREDHDLAVTTSQVYEHATPRRLAEALLGESGPAAPEASERAKAADEPIAVVGLDCRFPGAATPEALWTLLHRGGDAVGAFPDDRGWSLEGLFDDDPDAPGTSHTRIGGFLPGATRFDAAFFGISGREAAAMDPQQRVLLETAWHAIESAGLDARALQGTRTGVFLGAMPGDYGPALGAVGPGAGHRLTGTGPSIISGRLAYVLGLNGPALTVDTACSSSLVALHLAVASLRRGETDLALAGGVTVMSTTGMFVELTKLRAVSPRGRCRAFSEDADGTGWAEGCGVLVLERLSVARAAGHRVLGLIRGSAVNEDGASNGLTAPSGAAQRAVIRDALADAGLSASDVDVIEAHGTGTPLGDPIEAGAVLDTFGAVEREHPVLLGSLKSNIGHAQAAAGVGGVIKMLLAMQHRWVPATLHVTEPTSRVDWSAGAVTLATEAQPWPETGRPPRAGVSSFGIGGTNAHVIVEGVTVAEEPEEPGLLPHDQAPLVLSAPHDAGLAHQASALTAWWAEHAVPRATLARGLAARAPLVSRAALLPGSDPMLGLACLAGETELDDADQVLLRGRATEAPRVALVFPGQGSQWRGMAVDLLADCPVFRAHVDRCDELFSRYLDWSVRDALSLKAEPDVSTEATIQPLLFTVMTGLARLWREAGLPVSAVVGHSQGEVAAAWYSGALTLEQAVEIVVRRSSAWDLLPDHVGAMASVDAAPDELPRLLAPWADRVGVAAINAQGTVTLSGDAAAMDEALATLEPDHRVRRIRTVTVAGHSPVLEAIREPLAASLATLTPKTPRLPMYSTVTGAVLDRPLDASYWCDNMIGTVNFLDASRAMLADGITVFIEASGHPALAYALSRTIDREGASAAVLPTLRRDQGGIPALARALASAHVAGVDLDWSAILGTGPASAPGYAFAPTRHWVEPAPEAAAASALRIDRLPGDRTIVTWTGPAADVGRAIDGSPVLCPGTVVALALEAGRAVGCPRLASLRLPRVVVLGGAADLTLCAEAGAEGDRAACVVSLRTEEGWIEVARARLAEATQNEPRLIGGAPVPVALGDAHDLTVAPDLLRRLLPDDPGALPLAWAGVELRGDLSTTLSVGVERRSDSCSLRADDPEGTPVLVVEDVRLAATDDWADDVLRLGLDGLWAITWEPVAAAPQGTLAELDPSQEPADALVDAPEADTLVWDAPAPRDARGRAALTRLLADFAADAGRSRATLVVVTRGATDATVADAVPDPDAAAVWGLVRAAAAEHPGRFRLVDRADDVARADLRAALRTALPELVVTAAGAARPTLVAIEGAAPAAAPTVRPGTVLITGGTGSLAALAAEDLVVRAGVTDLLLVSRSGRAHPGAASLTQRLGALGARVRVEACDVSDADQVAALLDTLDPEAPLVGIVHTAGTLTDGVLAAQDERAFEKAFAAKVGGAATLDALSRGRDLDLFIVYASVVGAFGNAGQASYAAANAALEAIARRRRAAGERATSIAWGVWNTTSGMVDAVAGRDLARFTSRGLLPLEPEHGRALFAAVLRCGVSDVVAVPVDRARVRAAYHEPTTPDALRALVDAPAAPVEQRATAERLASLDAEDLADELRAVVRRLVAGILTGIAPQDVPTDTPFKTLGFDSLMGVELRNRLVGELDRPVPATLVFDHPTVDAVVRFLVEGTPRAAEPRAADEAPQSLDADAPVGTHAPATPAGATAVDDAIAVVAAACRLPGGVSNPDELWEALASGRDLVGPFPSDRGWPTDLHDPDPAHRWHSIAGEGGFLQGADLFDHAFFQISAREARSMDPQQRLLLETSWEALERGGLDPQALAGTGVGVYVGNIGQSYTEGMADDEDMSGYLITGGSGSVLAGRVSYALGLEGPSLSVDTGCSSSLVAVHLARRALLAGECRLALAAGVTVMAVPDLFVEFTRQGGMAPDGRCKAFSDAADGTAWAEGVVVLVLERLVDAQAAGHEVLGVLRGSAVNSDGASNGLTAPNGASQQRVIRAALADAGLRAGDVDLVESHGTGTVLGDPIEAQAILATYGQGRTEPVRVGALKSNTGHTQGAAGVAGILKVLLAMRHEAMPRNLHCATPSRHVDWEAGEVELLTGAQPWPRGERVRRAGVSAFGIGGTNAHVIVEEAPAQPAARPEPVMSAVPAPAWPLSARTPEALRAQAARLRAWLGKASDPLAVGRELAERATLDHRVVLLGADLDALGAALDSVASGRPDPSVVSGSAHAGKTAFVFTGQGAQRVGMGEELAAASEVFAAALAVAQAACDPHLEVPLKRATSDADLLARTEYAQPAIFALEVALFRQWEEWGITPDVVAGHSIGEVAAAHCAGVLDLADAARLVCARGRLMQQLPGGSMVALRLDQAAAEALIDGSVGVSLAAVNGPHSTVIAGPTSELERVVERAGQGTWLRVSHAFHSSMMRPMLDAFTEALAGITFHAPTLATQSTAVLGSARDAWRDPDYWVQHVLRPVLFHPMVESLISSGVRRFVELGPDAALCPALRESAPDALALPSLSRRAAEPDTMLRALAGLQVDGFSVDWPALLGRPEPGTRSLPTYAFQRRSFWRVPQRLRGRVLAPACDYRVAWRATGMPRPTARPVVLAARPDQQARAASWADALRVLGAEVTVVGLEAAEVQVAGAPAGTVLLTLGSLPDEARPGRPLEHLAALGRAAAAGRTPLDLVVATQGAVALEGAPVDPSQTALWGYGRVAALEQPTRFGALIDVDDQADPALVASLVLGHGFEDQWAVRGGRAWVPRVEAWRPEAARPPRVTGTLLITGGTGGLGAAVARHWADAGARHIALLSRRGADAPGAAELVADLETRGAHVRVLACDAADAGDLTRAFAAAERDWPTISAVVHAAGVVEFAPLDDVDADALSRVAGAKAGGAHTLDELTRGRALEAFVLFSSIAATWGSGGQTAYATANAELDGLAHARVARGEVALAVAWGPWAGSGMITGDGVESVLARRGLRPLEARQALDALDRLCAARVPAAVVADVDWESFGRTFQALRPRPLVAELVGVYEEPTATPSAEVSAATRLAAVPAAERAAASVDLVRRVVAGVAGEPDPLRIAVDAPFKALGFDSLMAVELRDRLREATGLRVGAMVIFDYPDVASLAAHVLAELVPTEELAAPAEPGALPAPVATAAAATGAVGVPDDLSEASVEDLFTLIDGLTLRS